jgi:hypothetical protein
MDVDLKPLTDDQLVELARLVAVEAIVRNPAVVTAAQSAVQSAIDAARASQDNAWANKKWLAAMVQSYIASGCTLTVWRSDAGVTRVYIDHAGSDRKGREATKWCYHVTGDGRNPPGDLTHSAGSRGGLDAPASIVKLIAQHAVRLYKSTRIDCDQAMATKYTVPAMPEDVLACAKVIAAQRAHQEKRSAYVRDAHVEIFAEYHSVKEAALERIFAELGHRNEWNIGATRRAQLDEITHPLMKVAVAALSQRMAAYDAKNPTPAGAA